jgi:hypothetical protein
MRACTEFNAQLRAQGMRVKDVAGDGNCMFRAICDQMEVSESRACVCVYVCAPVEKGSLVLHHRVATRALCVCV